MNHQQYVYKNNDMEDSKEDYTLIISVVLK